jgi:hypothetical protein
MSKLTEADIQLVERRVGKEVRNRQERDWVQLYGNKGVSMSDATEQELITCLGRGAMSARSWFAICFKRWMVIHTSTMNKEKKAYALIRANRAKYAAEFISTHWNADMLAFRKSVTRKGYDSSRGNAYSEYGMKFNKFGEFIGWD